MNVQSPNSPQKAAVTATAQPLQVRGRSFTAVVLRLTGATDKAFFDALDTLMRQAPHFFVNAPLVLDVEQAVGLDDKAAFVKLARQLRARRLTTVGIQNATPEQGTAAFGAGLVTLQNGRDATIERGGRPAASITGAPAPADPPAREPAPAPSLLVTEPVRSGQRIFADRGDLSCSPGQLGRRDHRRRQHPRLRHAARPRPRRRQRRPRGAHLLPQPRGGARRHRRPLPRQRGHPRRRGQRVQAFLEDERSRSPQVTPNQAGEDHRLAKIIVVTSGKGGVGKTTTTAAIAAGLAMRGNKTVVIDFDVGLRNLDLIMGCERRVVFDFINVIHGDAKLNQALIKDKRLDNLSVLPTSQTRDKDALTQEGVEKILDELATSSTTSSATARPASSTAPSRDVLSPTRRWW